MYCYSNLQSVPLMFVLGFYVREVLERFSTYWLKRVHSRREVFLYSFAG
jgi:hypothetical protein